MTTSNLASVGFVARASENYRKKARCLGCVVLGSLRVVVGPGEVSAGIGGAGTVDHRGTDPWTMVELVACSP